MIAAVYGVTVQAACALNEQGCHCKNSQNMMQLSLPNETITCHHQRLCAAPLCPRDIYLGERIWFPDEPICPIRSCPDWVRKQRKIARLPSADPALYFSYRMLNRLGRIDRDLQGANPDHVAGERRWFTKRISGKKRMK